MNQKAFQLGYLCHTFAKNLHLIPMIPYTHFPSRELVLMSYWRLGLRESTAHEVAGRRSPVTGHSELVQAASPVVREKVCEWSCVSQGTV